jgi:hypothetical protein
MIFFIVCWDHQHKEERIGRSCMPYNYLTLYYYIAAIIAA